MNYSEIEIRVRYGETDQMGVVYHANYAVYFEAGRTEWLRLYGLSYKAMEDAGIMLPVISLQVNYKKSAHYDELITVKTILKKTPTVRIAFDYEIYNESKELLATGNTVLAFIDKKNRRPTRCPKYLLDKLSN